MTLDPAFVDFAGRLADASGECILHYFRKPYGSSLKADATPVTQADREAEKIMRAMIEKQFPAHGIWGEEYGWHNQGADYIWSLDPVDGTRSFMAGFPTFGTLIALVHRRGAAAGRHRSACCARALDRRAGDGHRIKRKCGGNKIFGCAKGCDPQHHVAGFVCTRRVGMF